MDHKTLSLLFRILVSKDFNQCCDFRRLTRRKPRVVQGKLLPVQRCLSLGCASIVKPGNEKLIWIFQAEREPLHGFVRKLLEGLVSRRRYFPFPGEGVCGWLPFLALSPGGTREVAGASSALLLRLGIRSWKQNGVFLPVAF